MVGNAPQGHYETADGTTFYYRGSYIEGELELQDGYVEHAWVTKEELGEYFDADHHDLLKRMLLFAGNKHLWLRYRSDRE